MPLRPREITKCQAVQLRIQNQGLAQPFRRPSAVMKRLLALPAGDPDSASLSLFARCHPSAYATIHKTLSHPSRTIKSSIIRNIPQYILSDNLNLLRNALGEFHLVSTSDYLMAALTGNGYPFHPRIRRETHDHRLELLRYLKGVSNEQYLQRLSDLFLRYITAFGPAGISDFARWAGLPASSSWRIRNHLGARVRHLKINGLKDTFYVRKKKQIHESPPKGVHLLPAGDPVLTGYRPRNLLFRGGAPINRAVILLGCESVATWKMQRSPRKLRFSIRPFRALTDREESETAEKFITLAAFLSSAQYELKFLKHRTKGTP